MKDITTKRFSLSIGCLCLLSNVAGFAPTYGISSRISSSNLQSEATAATSESTDVLKTDPKEAVKIFGRLAEKYIMLDASAGMCCYSGCSDCEYREPGGGYRMADQSASRPKWIPVYDHREFASGKEHTSKWSSQIFVDGPAVTKEEFISRIMAMDYAPTLGGPYLAASAGSIEDETAIAALFDILAGEKVKLTKHRMGMEIKALANGEESLIWAPFSAVLGAN